MQSLGLAAWLVAALLLAVGNARAADPEPHVSRRTLRWRALAGAAGLMLLAGGLGALSPPTVWPLASGLGGMAGDLESNGLAGLANAVGAPVLAAVIEALLAAVGVWLTALALGLKWSHVIDILHVHRRAAATPRGDVRPAAPVRPARPLAAAPAAISGAIANAFANPAPAPAPASAFEPEPEPELEAPLAIRAPKPAAKPSAREARESQPSLFAGEEGGGFRLPELALLSKSKPRAAMFDEGALRQNARLLEGVLAEFGVRGQIDQIRPGPVVTLYELVPAPGVKSARVVALCDDIARSMSVAACRVSVVPGRNAIGIELPNPKRETVYLRDLLASTEYEKNGPILPLALGETIGGEPYIVDLSKMPHLLIAGTTGSGKSVGVNAMILSILYRLPPSQCRFIMVDPKMLELSAYDGIPHLLAPVVTDPKKAIVALKWTVREMEDRYRRMSKISVRNIGGYNDRAREAIAKGEHFVRTVQTGFDEQGRPVYEEEKILPEPMPYLVVVIDEVADLMMVAGKDIEGAVQRLAQMARAAGIHLIMATQRPSVDVITGTIKANFPTRISFQVTSKIDARTILGEQGAEQLLGQGDMLYMAGGGRITRLHGPFVSDGEVEAVAKALREQGQPQYLEEVTAIAEDDEDGGGDPLGGEGGGANDLYDQAVAVVTRDRKASTSYIQRRLQIGYNRAASLIERMEREGVVSAANHAGKRDILAGPPP
jgi:S-DNA-T family DNA segregation ATPase FtsK/SpoIIIE